LTVTQKAIMRRSRQLLDGPRDQGVALLDVNRFGQLLLALSVAGRGGGGEAEQCAVEGGLEHAQLPQDAQVVLRRRVVSPS
jgi:hypothetical protein